MDRPSHFRYNRLMESFTENFPIITEKRLELCIPDDIHNILKVYKIMWDVESERVLYSTNIWGDYILVEIQYVNPHEITIRDVLLYLFDRIDDMVLIRISREIGLQDYLDLPVCEDINAKIDKVSNMSSKYSEYKYTDEELNSDTYRW